MKLACFCAFMHILNMKAQKHACFRVNFPFSAYLYPPPYVIMVKGLLGVLQQGQWSSCSPRVNMFGYVLSKRTSTVSNTFRLTSLTPCVHDAHHWASNFYSW